MNKLTIIGNLTGNPESKVVNTQNGSKTVCNFTVAVNRKVRGENAADFFRVACWDRQAENAMKYLTKGKKVAVVGAVTCSAYTTQDGQARCTMEIQHADEIEYLSARGEDGTPAAAPAPAYATPQDSGFTAVETDELPF